MNLNNKNKMYIYYDLDLFGYYFCDIFLNYSHKNKKRKKLYTDSVSLLLSLDKVILKKEKYYEIIIL